MTETDHVLPAFGLELFGGHELIWGWLLGAFHASDEELPGWVGAACSTVVEIHSTNGPTAALRDMQADEDTAQIAHVMKSDALKQHRNNLQGCSGVKRRGQEHQNTRHLPVDEGHEMGGH